MVVQTNQKNEWDSRRAAAQRKNITTSCRIASNGKLSSLSPPVSLSLSPLLLAINPAPHKRVGLSEGGGRRRREKPGWSVNYFDVGCVLAPCSLIREAHSAASCAHPSATDRPWTELDMLWLRRVDLFRPIEYSSSRKPASKYSFASMPLAVPP